VQSAINTAIKKTESGHNNFLTVSKSGQFPSMVTDRYGSTATLRDSQQPAKSSRLGKENKPAPSPPFSSDQFHSARSRLGLKMPLAIIGAGS
jgi:hypothetical protein